MSFDIAVGEWPSGFYVAKLAASSRLGYAPLVVAPRALGEHRVAVVLSTRTWPAPTWRDDSDARHATGNAHAIVQSQQLGRPFANRGLPSSFQLYERPFLRWLHQTGRTADVLSQAEIAAATGDELASAYDLIVFPGQRRYVSRREHEALVRYRDLGGNLAFLAADESELFHLRSGRSGQASRLVPWTVRQALTGRWAFGGSSLATGRFALEGAPGASSRSVAVGAAMRDLLGPSMSAQVTYYETPGGARVFVSGSRVTKALPQRTVRRLLADIWRRLATGEPDAQLPATALRGELLRLPQYPTPALATPTQRAAALRLRAGIRAAARLWRDAAAAKRNGGFGFRRPRRNNADTSLRWYHAWHRGSHTDRSLNPKRPDALVYADVPGHPLVLVGVMYYMPRGTRGPTPGGPVTRWHWHRDCADGQKPLLKPRPDRTCPHGTRAVDTNEMMHVWFTGDLRSAYALHGPVHELCLASLLPAHVCDHAAHRHG